MKQYTIWLRQIFPLILGGSILTFLITKAILMQVTCDEAYTVVMLPKESVWNLVTYKSSYTNNHILNTLLVKWLFWVFQSTSHSLARVPNIVAFILYFYAVYCFAKKFIANDWVSLMFIILLCCNPYLLDFFNLARGYGLSVGCMMMSIYWAGRFCLLAETRFLPLSIFLSILSVYAQFASLHFYLGLNCYIFVFLLYKLFKNKDKKIFYFGIITQLLGAILLFLLIYLPISAIIRDNQIAYYGKDGFWENSILSQIAAGIYGVVYFHIGTFMVFKYLAILAAFCVVGRLAYLWGAKTIVSEERQYPLFFITSLFACVSMSIILQFHLLGNQYVIDRAAVFLYPFLAMLLVVVPLFFGQLKRWVFALTLSLFIIFPPYHLLRANKLNSYYEWWYDANTYEVLNILKIEYDKSIDKKPLHFHTSWMVNPSFSYHRDYQKMDFIMPLTYKSEVDTVNIYDFYYVERNELKQVARFYDKIKEWNYGEWTLLRKKSTPQ
jgi:hypothetical protein